MGAFSEWEKEKHEHAYGEGVKDAQNTGFWGDLFHGLGDTVTVLVPETTEHQSYEQGYDDQRQGKVRK